MSLRIAFAALFWGSLLCVWHLCAQTPASGPALAKYDFEDLRSEIEAIKSDPIPPGTYADLWSRVYRTRNFDLIALCWEKSQMDEDRPGQMLIDPDVNFRAHLVLSMLRSKSWGRFDYAPDDKNEAYDGARGLRFEYCTVILKRYLPAAVVAEYPLNQPNNRLQIAVLFEKALGTTAKSELNSGPISAAMKPPISFPTEDDGKMKRVVPQPASSMERRKPWARMIAIGITALIILTVMIRLGKRSWR